MKALDIDLVTGTTEPVPVALEQLPIERATGTPITEWLLAKMRGARIGGPSVEEPLDECDQGIGALLRDGENGRMGRDVQLACQRRSCPTCGPRGRERRSLGIVAAFAGGPLHAVLMEDSEEEWEAFHKKYIDRGGANYFRIPTPECKLVVLTTADTGELISSGIQAFVAAVIDVQPCDGRRMTSSREWQGVGAKPSTKWKREGLSTKPQAKRVLVYEEEGLGPDEGVTLDEDVVRSYDLELPPKDSDKMKRVAEKVGLFEPPEQLERVWG